MFSEEDGKRNEEEFRDIFLREEWLDVQVMALMGSRGIVVDSEGCVDAEDFEEAQEKADQVFVEISTGMDEELAEKFRRHWPMREGKFVHFVESCV